jgi:hypothetical protein
MPFVFKRLALLMSIAAAFAADKTPPPFKPGPPDTLPHHQANDSVVIGVDAYDGGEKVKVAFGKVDPYQLGVLPVLVVIKNDTGKAISLEHLRAEYVGPNHDRVDATPAKDVKFLKPPQRPSAIGGPGGKIKVLAAKKNPLDEWEIEGRAFSAQMLPAGNTASGFLYFQTGMEKGATIYITGLADAGSGKELLFFEIPLT